MSDASAWAREELETAGGDREVAHAAVKKRVHASRAVYRKMSEKLVDDALWYYVRMASQSANRQLLAPSGEAMAVAGSLQAVAAVNAEAELLSYRMSTGMRLSLAQAGDCQAEAELHEKFSVANGIKSRWMLAIVSKLPDDEKIVGDVLTNLDLAELWEASHVAA